MSGPLWVNYKITVRLHMPHAQKPGPETLGKKKTKVKPKNFPSLLEAAREINKLGQKGPRDLAANLDDYLYGGKK